MPTLQVIADWLLANPARLMVGISLCFTLLIGFAEKGGRNSGGSGWLTLFRIAIGAIFTVATVVVATLYDGLRGFLLYGTLQVLICVVIPALWLEDM